jgi:hypothetical protein
MWKHYLLIGAGVTGFALLIFVALALPTIREMRREGKSKPQRNPFDPVMHPHLDKLSGVTAPDVPGNTGAPADEDSHVLSAPPRILCTE